MGNPKQKWTAEEEEALRAGVAKHGAGKWKLIQRDPEFNSFLHSRSNIDLKDKWRNLGGCGSGINLRDKSRNIKPKVSLDVQCNTLVAEQTSSAVVLYDPSDNPAVAHHDPSDSPAMENSSKCSLDAKSTVMFNSMIFEALSTLNEPSGSDIGAIVSFIEREHEIPPNFRRSLGSRLRKLAALNKIEKVQHRYKMKADASLAVRTPLLTQKREIRVSQPWTQNTRDEPRTEYTEAAAANAALMISDAETKSYVAAEAVKEMERVLRMAEDADSMLQFATEIFDRCSGGEVLMMA